MEVALQTSSSIEEENAENSKLIVVILVGPPGSGKSTFCEHVMQAPNRPWTRICQDTIGNGGKAGTRSQCFTSAASALKNGSSVLIDRCNIDREQRAEFLKLGGDEVEKHCVLLDLPAKLCISRAMKRMGHEGNLQGGKAAAVVNRVLQKKELPKLSEGFSRIMHCTNEDHVGTAVGTYRKLGSVGALPSGYFGQKNPDSKVQLGIMRFLKKLDPPASIKSKADDPKDESLDKVSSKKAPVCKPENVSPAHSDLKHDVTQSMQQDEVLVENMSVSKPEESSPAIIKSKADVPQDVSLDKVSSQKAPVCKPENLSPAHSDLKHGVTQSMQQDEVLVENMSVSKPEESSPANIKSKADVPQDVSLDKVSSQKAPVCKPENLTPAHSDLKHDVTRIMQQDEVLVENMSVSKPEESSPVDSDVRNDVAEDVALDKVSVKKVPACKEDPGHSDVRSNEILDFANETSPTENVPSLAFPSISTADFHFDLEEASNIIVEKVEEFIDKLGNARLVLVDISRNSKILALVRRKIEMRNIDSSKFLTFVGDITQLFSRGGLQCNVIANATNWQLKPGGGGVNAAIFSAAGQELESATNERAKFLRPGNSVIVPVSSSSPLFTREGVTHVVHVLGPNMNPWRPDCLNNDYVRGRNVLRKAYSSLFEAFVSIVRSTEAFPTVNIDDSPERQDDLHGSPSRGYQKPRMREASDLPGNNKRYKCFYKELGTDVFYSGSRQKTSKNEESKCMSKTLGSYSQALYNIAMHPDRHKNDVIEVLEDVVVINDLYPKAQKHLLVLARTEGLDSLADVDEDHLSLLNTMHDVGLKHAQNLLKDNESLIFRIGYHSVPSMRQLHLHVISQDFDSKHLKNRKHWNSFNTPFFRDSVDVMEEVCENGKPALVDDENILKKELRCHRCRSAHPNIPRLKSHITSCQAPFASALRQNGRLTYASI